MACGLDRETARVSRDADLQDEANRAFRSDRGGVVALAIEASLGRGRGSALYEIVSLRGNCELSSRNVFFVSSSFSVGWTFPVTSVTRDTRVCSPGVAPDQT